MLFSWTGLSRALRLVITFPTSVASLTAANKIWTWSKFPSNWPVIYVQKRLLRSRGTWGLSLCFADCFSFDCFILMGERFFLQIPHARYSSGYQSRVMRGSAFLTVAKVCLFILRIHFHDCYTKVGHDFGREENTGPGITTVESNCFTVHQKCWLVGWHPFAFLFSWLRVRLLLFPEPLDLAVSVRRHHHHPVSYILPHQAIQTLRQNNPKWDHRHYISTSFTCNSIERYKTASSLSAEKKEAFFF